MLIITQEINRPVRGHKRPEAFRARSLLLHLIHEMDELAVHDFDPDGGDQNLYLLEKRWAIRLQSFIFNLPHLRLLRYFSCHIGNFKTDVITSYDSYIMALVPAAVLLLFTLVTLIWKCYFSCQLINQ